MLQLTSSRGERSLTGLLRGAGKFMRHVKLEPGAAVDEAALAGLIRAAYVDMSVCLDAEP